MKAQAEESIVNDHLKPEVPEVDVPIYSIEKSIDYSSPLL